MPAIVGEGTGEEQCGACHGQTLAGLEMAPALAGPDFLDKWSSQTVGDLFHRIRTTMPLDKPGRLSLDVNSDITAFILQVNGFPVGKAELPRDAQVLGRIRIEAARPDGK